MIGPAQRLISGVDTISQNFKEKQVDYNQWDMNARVETATIATALTVLVVPPFYQLWGQLPVSLQKTSTTASFFFATEGRIPSSQPQEDTNPWWNPRSGAWKGCWIFYRVQMSYFCKNGRAEELCPKPVRELLKGQCRPGHCDPVCWVPFPSWEGVCGAAVHKGGYIFSLRERGRFSRAQHLLLLVNPLVSAAFRDQTPY